MPIRLYFLTVLLIMLGAVSAVAQYQVNESCMLAWQQIMDLKFTSAAETIASERKENPTNYYTYYLEQSAEALALVINPSDELYSTFEKNFDRRMQIINEKDAGSPYYLACRSEMLLQMCIFNVLYGDKLSGVRKGYQAYKATYQNREKYPGFEMSKKLDGFFNVAVSNLPSFVRWAANVFGVSGNAHTGVSMLKNYYETVKAVPGLNLDAAVFVILPYKLNKEPVKAFNFIKTLDSTLVKYKIIHYFYINTAYRSGRNELARRELKKFDPQAVEIDFPPYDYMMGKVLLRKLDNNAIIHFQSYLRNSKNDNYIKETFYNIALYYLVKGDVQQFKYYKLQADENGKAVNERDRESVYDAQLDYIPDVHLARAKLLTDGSYVDQAGSELNSFHKEGKTFLPYRLEYHLLKGRLLLADGQPTGAVNAFKKVLKDGDDVDYYFACEAALRLGWIYLDSDKQIAKAYFEQSLELYQSEFYEYLEEIALRELKLLE